MNTKLNKLIFIIFIFLGLINFLEGIYSLKIISLTPSITESLFLLGVGDNVVGVTTYCEYPSEAKKKEKIGSLLSLNIEKIVLLKPDIVIGTGINRLENFGKISKLGIKVHLFENESSFLEICNDFLELGKLIEKEKRAAEIIRKSKQGIEKIKKSIKSVPLKNMPKVFLVYGTNPLVTITKGTFSDEIISIAGGINIAHNLSGKYIRYSKEEVLKQNPDVIIIVGMGIASKQEKKLWAKYKDLSAVKKNQIYIIEDAHNISAPNPVTFVQAVKFMAELLHPEIFKK